MSKTIRLKKLTPTQKQAAETLTEATIAWIKLSERETHPEGKFDKAGRFYLEDTYDCCRDIRMPSAAYPYSLMVHARIADHVAAQFGIEAKTLRKLKREWLKNADAIFEENRAGLAIVEVSLGRKPAAEIVNSLRRNFIFKVAATLV